MARTQRYPEKQTKAVRPAKLKPFTAWRKDREAAEYREQSYSAPLVIELEFEDDFLWQSMQAEKAEADRGSWL
jgi:hypothetical protein